MYVVLTVTGETLRRIGEASVSSSRGQDAELSCSEEWTHERPRGDKGESRSLSGVFHFVSTLAGWVRLRSVRAACGPRSFCPCTGRVTAHLKAFGQSHHGCLLRAQSCLLSRLGASNVGRDIARRAPLEVGRESFQNLAKSTYGLGLIQAAGSSTFVFVRKGRP